MASSKPWAKTRLLDQREQQRLCLESGPRDVYVVWNSEDSCDCIPPVWESEAREKHVRDAVAAALLLWLLQRRDEERVVASARRAVERALETVVG